MTARSDIDERVLDEALAWQVALEQDDADWDGYMAWLEADPCHRKAFDSVALAGAVVNDHRGEVEKLLAGQTAAERPRRGFARTFAYAAGGMVAAIALMIAVPQIWAPQSMQRYSANGSTSRSVMLGNGVHVTLSPASSIIVRNKDAQIELARGEAFFDVRHDPSRALTVAAGDYSISDIGTRFSVNLAGRVFRVGVSEGRVAVASPGSEQAVEVSAGHQLVAGDNGLTLSPVSVVDVGSWRAGRLSYSDAPLSLVVADISRYAGKPVTMDSSLEKTHFSGTLVIGDGSRLLRDLAAVMGVEVRTEGDGARIGVSAR